MKQLQKEIKLLKEELAKPEANANDLFGQYLGAESRKDVPKPNEKDTREEKTVIGDLNYYITGGGGDVNLDGYDQKLLNLIRQHKYTKFLQPSAEFAYRVLETDLSLCSKLTGLNEKEITTSNFQVSEGFVLKPQNNLSSWTEEITLDMVYSLFNTVSLKPNRCFIIIKANVRNNAFILNWKNLSDSNIFSPEASRFLKSEKEMIGIGPIHSEKSAVFYNSTKEEVQFKTFLPKLFSLL